jgi:hypothetical protein
MRTTDPTSRSKLLTMAAIALALLLGAITHWAGVDRGFGLVLP